MTSVLACIAPDKFAAFAPVAVIIYCGEQRSRGRSRSRRSTAPPTRSCRTTAARCTAAAARCSPSKPVAMANWAAHDQCNAKFTDTRLGSQVRAPHVDGLHGPSAVDLLHHQGRRPHLARRDPDPVARAHDEADQRQQRDLEVLLGAHADELMRDSMTAHDLVVRGATVIDGTGAPGVDGRRRGRRRSDRRDRRRAGRRQPTSSTAAGSCSRRVGSTRTRISTRTSSGTRSSRRARATA